MQTTQNVKKTTTKEEFLDTITAYPLLTAHGFVVDQVPGTTKQGYYDLFNAERAKLFTLYDEFELCCQWIANVANGNLPDTSSYHQKHLVERWADTYINEGAYVAAAISLGFDPKILKGTPSVKLERAIP